MASLSTIHHLNPSSLLKPRQDYRFSPSKTRPTFHHSNNRSLSLNSVVSSSTETEPKIPQTVDRFWQWLKDEGIVSSKTPVKPGIVPEGLGLVATRDIPRNGVVLEVPRKFWLNPDAAAASDIGALCSGLKPWISVALLLLRERLKGADSNWKYYLDVLPQGTDSTIYWSEEELLEIQGTQLLSTTLSVKEYVKNEFLNVEKEIILPNKQLFPLPITLDDFFWAFGMLRSRAFSLRSQNLVIVPFADLINHSMKVTTEDHLHEVRGAAGLFSWDYLFQIRSPLSLKAGEQVFIQYSLNKSSADMALDYGFIELENTSRNGFTLTLEISESDEFFEDKLDVAEMNGLGESAYFDIKDGQQALQTEMLQYLRLLALGGTDAFLLESIFRNKLWGFLELPVSRANEELICQVVRSACKSALAGYHTSIEEDEKLIEEGNLSSRLAVAVGVRIGEKKVLQQIDDIFRERESELDFLEYYQERRLKDLGLVGEQGDIIFWEPK
ncbi:ribulose-1,5 bisphosphate carboxylase/oxygenase large subunit N-methyltransferase, chloroplastic [Salvia hispanica]|uniref:ribulose-1,5 bisphosphate carboxylase/oxygenase large subunit N-methyltransferase, chloroplastic n=1 Tax=Salvia hispanica TaxID=49212 RepID=UPI0020098CB0|nr:ribulose-1,5 bisphosphate carboxylase/oxygenase large subunit N-methyltransferase, chloroplastic [Salvia hispanica]